MESRQGAKKSKRKGKEGGDSLEKGAWEAVIGTDDTCFKVKIKKKLGGIPIPNAVLSYICESVLPRTVAKLVAESLPKELGPLVGVAGDRSGYLPKECCAKFALSGQFNVKGKIAEKCLERTNR